MKTKFSIMPHGITFLLIVLLALAACDSGTGITTTIIPTTEKNDDDVSDDDVSIVLEKYRFENGMYTKFTMDRGWNMGPGLDTLDPNVFDYVSALGETTFTVTGGGINISYINVYTGENVNKEEVAGYEWVYLYGESETTGYSGKIGIVEYNSTTGIDVYLGKRMIEDSTVFHIEHADDVQDDDNGEANFFFPFPQ